MKPKISQNLSSNTLFHFTRSLGILMGILQSGFKLTFVPELLPKKAPNGESLYYVVPMVCFCDIPLGGIKVHLEEYGNYGLGVHKKICQVKNINPVFYIHNCRTFDAIFPNTIEDSTSVIPYVKEYSGNSVKKDKVVRFYNEREWRHVDTGKMQILQGDRDRALKVCKGLNQEYDKYLRFELDNFEYIIVKNTVDVYHIIEMIYAYMKEIPEERKRFLCSKIISAIRIKGDF